MTETSVILDYLDQLLFYTLSLFCNSLRLSQNMYPVHLNSNKNIYNKVKFGKLVLLVLSCQYTSFDQSFVQLYFLNSFFIPRGDVKYKPVH